MKKACLFLAVFFFSFNCLIIPSYTEDTSASSDLCDSESIVVDDIVINNMADDSSTDSIISTTWFCNNHSFTIYSTHNSSTHTLLCSTPGCAGYRTESHSMYYSTVCTTSDYCTNTYCPYILRAYTSHHPTGIGSYHYWNASQHYRKCGKSLSLGNTCEFKSSFSDHRWSGSGSIATCLDCGYQKS